MVDVKDKVLGKKWRSTIKILKIVKSLISDYLHFNKEGKNKLINRKTQKFSQTEKTILKNLH